MAKLHLILEGKREEIIEELDVISALLQEEPENLQEFIETEIVKEISWQE